MYFNKEKIIIILKSLVLILMLALTGLIFFQKINFTSLDLGRHLENGKVIWSEPQVLYKNLFSYTEPDHPFTNHHWLSGVAYFLLYQIGGFKGLNILNILLALGAVLVTWLHARKVSGPIIAAIIGLPAIIMMSERTDIRPEMFSLLFIVLTFYLLEKWRGNENKGKSNRKILFTLVGLLLIWVNLHIYFFAGLFLISLFATLSLVMDYFKWPGPAAWKNLFNKNRQKIYLMAGTWIACLINPHFIYGLTYPFNIFKTYGYDIVENKSPFYLEKLMLDQNILVYKVFLGVVIFSFALKIILDLGKKRKLNDERFIFNLTVSIFFIVLSAFAIRNLPIFGLICWPVAALNFYSIRNDFFRLKEGMLKEMVLVGLSIAFILFLLALNHIIIDGKNEGKIIRNNFGLSLASGADDSIKFFRENNLAGPIFNNYDLGSALTFWLYPKEKVFTDNRPEAYSKEFFQQIYVPMQNNEDTWKKYSGQYGINLIYFSHPDGTPWARQFLASRLRDPDWPLIYFDAKAVIMIKNDAKNQELVKKFALDKERFEERFGELVKNNGEEEELLLANLADLYGNDKLAENIYNSQLARHPESGKIFLSLGQLLSGRPNAADQIKAINYLKNAISQGYELPGIYNQMGLCYWNLSDYNEAKKMWEKALRIDKNNATARYYLNQARELVK